MNKQLAIWKLIAGSLQMQIQVLLLYVLESSGSSPGRQGFFMAVANGGPSAPLRMEGSIGGGVMEYKFVEMAKEKLRVASLELRETSIKKQFHDKLAAANQSGMICSGEQTVLLYIIHPDEAAYIQKIISCLQQNKNGTLTLSPKGIQFDNGMPENNFEFSMKSEEDWLYKEKIGYKNELFIIGGGHCALAFSKLMRSMDFYIRLYEERKDLKTMIENDSVHEKYFVADYKVLNELIPSGNNHYVVIMTFGYRTDDVALRALLNKEFKYLGLLGSKSKIEKLFTDYHKEGIPKERLQQIHTPIGISIKSQTPEEIAVSIAAEIIRVKNS
jgi:xanthine dehydrogenase accessory factor